MGVPHFINLESYTSADIKQMLEKASEMKGQQKRREDHSHLKGLNIGMMFDKSSLRTRVSFEVGINQLGGSAIVLGNSAGKLGEREPIADYARVLSRYVDAIVCRTYEEGRLEQLAEHSSVPVVNALTDESHPCQAMADMLTLQEHWGSLEGKSLVYVGDSNNVARSLMRASEKLGLEVRIASPKNYSFSDEEQAWGKERGFSFFTDPKEAVAGANALYTDVWTSMGQEEEKEQRLNDFQGFCIDTDLIARADSDVKVLHCLPAHRGEEISDDVIEGPHSVVFDQAENRLHAQKAILTMLLS